MLPDALRRPARFASPRSQSAITSGDTVFSALELAKAYSDILPLMHALPRIEAENGYGILHSVDGSKKIGLPGANHSDTSTTPVLRQCYASTTLTPWMS